MQESKKTVIFILTLLAVLLCIVAAYSIVDRIHAPTEESEPEIWYVSDSALWRGFRSAVEEFNISVGEKYGIRLTTKSFPDEAALCEAVTEAADSGDAPDMVVCDSDLAAVMNGLGMLSDMDLLPRRIGSRNFSARLISEAQLGEKLLLIPVASSVDVFIVNTAKLPQLDSELTFEQLCIESGKYYATNSEPLFTISDYAWFFKNASHQLGESFDGVSPHDTDSKTSKYIYRQLAEAAYNRGYGSVGEDAAKLVFEGELPCAFVSSDEIMQYAHLAEPLKLDIRACPCMYGGDPVCVENVYGISILASDENSVRASAKFVEWFCSEKVNREYVNGSGCMCATGDMPDGTDSEIYSKLSALISGLLADGRIASIRPNAVYCIKSHSFNKTLTTIMDSLS